MKKVIKLILIIPLFLLASINIVAGDKVKGAIVSLSFAANMELYSSIETDNSGGFEFPDVPPGEYILTVKIPFTSISDNFKHKDFLEKLIDGGCDKNGGRLVFKLNYNCFVLDLNCEDLPSANMQPYFNISEEETGYLITIAEALIYKKYNLKGLFQALTPQNYEGCLKSGKFQLL